jgi:hypothetical protein
MIIFSLDVKYLTSNCTVEILLLNNIDLQVRQSDALNFISEEIYYVEFFIHVLHNDC